MDMDIITTMKEFLGGDGALYLQALLVVGLGLVVLLIANAILKKRIKNLEEKSTDMDAKRSIRSLPVLRFFQRIALPLLFLGLVSIGVEMVAFDERIQSTVRASFAILMTIIIVRSINKGIELAFSRH